MKTKWVSRDHLLIKDGSAKWQALTFFPFLSLDFDVQHSGIGLFRFSLLLKFVRTC